MLNGDGNENGIKINRSNQQKNKLHVQHTFFSNQQKTILHVQHAFCLSLPSFCKTTTLFCTTKTSNFLVTHYFYGGSNCRMCLPNILSPVIMFALKFSLPLIFTLLVASISHCRTKFVSFVFNDSLQLFLCYPRECKHQN